MKALSELRENKLELVLGEKRDKIKEYTVAKMQGRNLTALETKCVIHALKFTRSLHPKSN